MRLKVFLKLKKTLKPSFLGKKTQKTPKNPKNPKNLKKPTGLGFLKKKTGFFHPCMVDPCHFNVGKNLVNHIDTKI
jgi:hypothetical protein